MRYNVNEGPREWAVRLGCEKGLYAFIHDYAQDMGLSMSGAARRLVLIGAHCEKEHAHLNMPAAHSNSDVQVATNNALAESYAARTVARKDVWE